MQAIQARITKGINFGARIPTCDNSGAKVIKVFGAKGVKTVKGRMGRCGVGDLVIASVVKGKPEMRKQTVMAVIVRQKKEYRRLDGTRIKFEDNAAVIVKDDKGSPKGTILKGAIAKEAAARWGNISKIARIVV
ncbi:50S ribosomal protein L14 [Candidatus Woesearchaeota archaeon]|nr:50S ribosomal protein L14 [Candidatus Woesearchaeota archaeon]